MRGEGGQKKGKIAGTEYLTLRESYPVAKRKRKRPIIQIVI